VDDTKEINLDERRIVTSNWPSDRTVCPAVTSVQQSIKNMVRQKTKNKRIIDMFRLSDKADELAAELVEIFRGNMHTRIVQFYYENASVHFCDLLLNKVETSSGLLSSVRNILGLRKGLASRTIENIRTSARLTRTFYTIIDPAKDIISCLLERKIAMFPNIEFITVEEVLYDDKFRETQSRSSMLTVRRCSPTHYRHGVKVYDDPKMGNEVLYKGELIDDDRMLSHKEELLVAKLTAVTKWFLMKHSLLKGNYNEILSLDCVKACDASLSTLTDQKFMDLVQFTPTEVGGEILHRIPNMRFSSSTYIRSEMNRSLNYTTDLNQEMITKMGLVDSNINFDYIRMRFLLLSIVRDKYDEERRLVMRYNFTNLSGICDVQFVKPKPVIYESKFSPLSYSKMTGNTLSLLRFRYLAHAYLFEENQSEWAIMPNLTEEQSLNQMGRAYINDIIFRYHKELDKEHMSIGRGYFDKISWTPLITKLYAIDPNWKINTAMDDVEELAIRLRSTLEERQIITTIAKSERVKLSIQTSAIEEIKSRQPIDIEFDLLASTYSDLTLRHRSSMKLSRRLAQYQELIRIHRQHRTLVAKYLILEYVVFFHIKFDRLGNKIEIDAEGSVKELLESGFGSLSMMIINPELFTRLTIIGLEFLESVIQPLRYELVEELQDISDEVSLIDIIVPENLPSIAGYTHLSGQEPIPESLLTIEYELQEIPHSSLSSLSEISAVCKYMTQCSTIGADPGVFFSHTGSDSLGPQIALFRSMLREELIGRSTKICDLTAGRGDGCYAMKYLGLNSISYTKPDTFSKLYYHPDIIFKDDYDLSNGTSLKFISNFEFIHIDISFLGSSDLHLIDLMLLCEEQNLGYSIRLNSIKIDDYPVDLARYSTNYSYYISYASNSTMKPYHCYLVAVPIKSGKPKINVSMKQTIAFRSIALGYSKLLNPIRQRIRLNEYEPNSISLYLPHGSNLLTYLKSLLSDSISTEQLYYCNRFLKEVGADDRIQLAPHRMTVYGQDLVKSHANISKTNPDIMWSGLKLDQIGNVSDKSRHFHELHLASLVSGDPRNIELRLSLCSYEFLTFLRTHHPIQAVRSQSNIILGLYDFCGNEVRSGYDAIIGLSRELSGKLGPKITLHQREIHMAMKILVLSSFYDDYNYGLQFINDLIYNKSGTRGSLIRTLKVYRLLSYNFDWICDLRNQGLITIQEYNAIKNDLVERETKKYKYQKVKEPPDSDIHLDQSGTIDIDFSIDKLLHGIEDYVRQTPEAPVDEPQSILSTLDFDIGIGDIVNDAIERLNLKPSGPHGFIDLGDEYQGDPELW